MRRNKYWYVGILVWITGSSPEVDYQYDSNNEQQDARPRTTAAAEIRVEDTQLAKRLTMRVRLAKQIVRRRDYFGVIRRYFIRWNLLGRDFLRFLGVAPSRSFFGSHTRI